MNTLMTKAQWADHVGVTTKTVDRWLAAGQLPDAVRQGSRWFFSADTKRPVAGTSQDVPGRGGTSQDVPGRAAVSPVATAGNRLLLVPERETVASPVAVGGSLEEFAAMTGCSATGVRRLFDDVAARPGLPFYVGRYGPHGAMRVVAFPAARA